jgi:hypothetical protein
MADGTTRRLIVRARHGTEWVTITVLAPERADRVAAIAAGALTNPGFDLVRVDLESEPGAVRRTVFEWTRPPGRAKSGALPGWFKRGLAVLGRTTSLSSVAFVFWALMGSGDDATASLPRDNPRSAVSLPLPAAPPPPGPAVETFISSIEAAVLAAPAPVAPPAPRKAVAKAAPPPKPAVAPEPPREASEPAPAPAPVAALPTRVQPSADGPRPAAVASWINPDANPFDRRANVFSTAPLPPEAVPVPVPASASAPEPPEVLAEVPPPEPAPPPPRTTQAPLNGVRLVLGESMGLGRAKPDAASRCRGKEGWSGTYCLEAVDWPEAARPLFAMGSYLHPGGAAVVRHDAGRAVAYHVQFENRLFDAVVAYLESRFGPPTAIPEARMAWLGRQREANTAYRWTSLGSPDTVLEIRRFDDASASFPDRTRGVIELRHVGAPTVFTEVKSLDLVRLSVAGAR